MSQETQVETLARKPKWVEVNPNLWAQLKSSAALHGMTMSEAIEEAIAEWLAE